MSRQIEEVEHLLKEQSAKKSRKKTKKKRAIKDHSFKFLLCIDFEATCFEMPQQQKRKIQEIIEFPVVLINLETGLIECEVSKKI
jgi:ERI1 exoribonuclease 2